MDDEFAKFQSEVTAAVDEALRHLPPRLVHESRAAIAEYVLQSLKNRRLSATRDRVTGDVLVDFNGEMGVLAFRVGENQ